MLFYCLVFFVLLAFNWYPLHQNRYRNIHYLTVSESLFTAHTEHWRFLCSSGLVSLTLRKEHFSISVKISSNCCGATFGELSTGKREIYKSRSACVVVQKYSTQFAVAQWPRNSRGRGKKITFMAKIKLAEKRQQQQEQLQKIRY